MRITIDIDGAQASQDETTSSPTAAPKQDAAATAAPGVAAIDHESAAEVARRTGATDAGPAPSGPGDGTGAFGTSDAPSGAQWTAGGESAGAAPV